MTNPDHLNPDDLAQLTIVLDACPELAATARHVRDFADLMNKQRGDRVDTWIQQVQADDLPHLHSLTAGLRRDLAAVPPVNETDDAAIGLVREYEIGPNLWGRYEVRLTVPAEPFTDSNSNGVHDDGEPFTDTNGNAKRDDARETRDVSIERGLAGSGAVWPATAWCSSTSAPSAGHRGRTR